MLMLMFFKVMWNDIDLYHALRDFTSDPVSFPAEEVRAFIQDLVRLSITRARGARIAANK